MSRISILQTSASKAWSGFTDKNHIGQIFHSKPQVASNIVSRMLAQTHGSSLNMTLDSIPSLYLDTDDDYTWQLIGSSDRNIELVAAYTDPSLNTAITATDTNIGIAGQEFYLVFPERWFSDVNVIVGEKNEIYPIQVVADPQPFGNDWVYKCVMWGDAQTEGMPGEELVGGKRFSKEASPVEDALSVKGGEVGFSSPITFRNHFSQIRMQYEAPGNMRNMKFVGSKVPYVDNSGNKKEFVTWMDWLNYEFEYQFDREKTKWIWFGRSARDAGGRFLNKGKSGRVIRAGAGIREQMETANTYYYNYFSIDLLTNILTDLAENKLEYDERKFVIRTGERGAILFHKAVSDVASGWTPLQDSTAQSNTQSMLHENARKFGYQYTEYMAPNQIHVKIEVDPLYSDPVRNKIPAPSNGHFIGGLAESYRMDILDIGTIDGEPNIRKVYPKNEPDVTAYIPGLRDPFSPTGAKPKQIASPKDGYYVTKFATCSAMVKDPTRTASLIPSILR